MKKRFVIGFMAFSLLLSGCATQTSKETAVQTSTAATETQTASIQETESLQENTSVQEETNSKQDEKKSIVLYFNYSENIDTTGLDTDAISSASLHSNGDGNTENLELMAKEIAKKKNADLFPIKINEVYPADFNEMAPKAREDIEKGTSFTFQNLPENLDDYDVIYVGSPIWWYELPQPMKVFIKEVDASDKTVVPFGIHRGSGFNGILDEYKEAWPNATVVDGFTINADEKNSEVQKSFDEFLDGLEY